MIAPKLDFFSIFIFVGALQGALLAFYFIFKKEGNPLAHYTLASILLCFALVLFDIFSGYTGYIVNYIYLNNISDPFVFFLGPLCYLYTKSQTQGIKKIDPKQFGHFIIPLLMLLYFTLYFIQPDALKYNDFLSSFHPEIKINYVEPVFEPDPFYILKNVVVLMISHLAVYMTMSIRLINQILRSEGSTFFSFTNSTLAPLRVLLSGFVFALIVFAMIKLLFYNDLGDHIIATYTSLIVYSITIYLISDKYFPEEEDPG